MLFTYLKKIILYFDKKFLYSSLINSYINAKYLIQINKVYLNINSQNQSIKNHNLNKELLVSLTSYYKRFDTLPLVLDSLQRQTIKPDKIELWIENKDIKFLPKKISKFRDVNLRVCENDLFSYKKIIPALIENQNRYIVTFDDDIIYSNKCLEKLIIKAKIYPEDIVANRVHKMKIINNVPDNYNNWDLNNTDNHGLNFFTGAGGVLYPPNCFYEDVTIKEHFKKLCPHNDDIWLNWMVRLNKKKVVNSQSNEKFVMIKKIKSGLYKKNVKQNFNDEQIKRIILKYGFPYLY
jgi:hypothetical protein